MEKNVFFISLSSSNYPLTWKVRWSPLWMRATSRKIHTTRFDTLYCTDFREKGRILRFRASRRCDPRAIASAWRNETSHHEECRANINQGVACPRARACCHTSTSEITILDRRFGRAPPRKSNHAQTT